MARTVSITLHAQNLGELIAQEHELCEAMKDRVPEQFMAEVAGRVPLTFTLGSHISEGARVDWAHHRYIELRPTKKRGQSATGVYFGRYLGQFGRNTL